MVVQLVEFPSDGGDRMRVQTHDGRHRQERIDQVAEYAGVALTLFDVGCDGVEDGDDLALSIRVELLHDALDRRDDCNRVVVVAWGWR